MRKRFFRPLTLEMLDLTGNKLEKRKTMREKIEERMREIKEMRKKSQNNVEFLRTLFSKLFSKSNKDVTLPQEVKQTTPQPLDRLSITKAEDAIRNLKVKVAKLLEGRVTEVQPSQSWLIFYKNQDFPALITLASEIKTEEAGNLLALIQTLEMHTQPKSEDPIKPLIPLFK